MKKYLVLILLAVIVSSCQDEILNDSNPVIENVNVNLSMDEAMSIANDNPTNLSEDEILAMVNDFSSSLSSKTRSAANPRMSIVGSYRIALAELYQARQQEGLRLIVFLFMRCVYSLEKRVGML